VAGLDADVVETRLALGDVHERLAGGRRDGLPRVAPRAWRHGDAVVLDRGQRVEVERHPVRAPAPFEASRDEDGGDLADRFQAGRPAPDAALLARPAVREHRVCVVARDPRRERQRPLVAARGDDPAQRAVRADTASRGVRTRRHPARVVARGGPYERLVFAHAC
jgi:hypothetical protein